MIPFTMIMIFAYILIASDKINKTLVAIGGAAATISTAYIYFFLADVVIFTEEEILTEIVDWGAIIIILSLFVIYCFS